MNKDQEKIGITYIRVSTKEQTLGNSLDVQKEDNLKKAENFGYKRDQVVIFDDRGESAKTADRPGLIKLLEFCRQNKDRVGHLFIWKVDRLSRNIIDYYAIKLQLIKYGVTTVFSTEAVNDEPSGKIMEAVLAATAEINNKINADRAISNMKRQLENGISPWKLPIGYMNEQNKKHGRKKTTPDPIDPERFPIVQRGLKEFAAGMHTVSSLTRQFCAWGLTTRSGKKIYPQMVDRMLTDVTYIGWLPNPWGDEPVKNGQHKPAIILEEYQKIQLIKAGKKVVAKPRERANPEFPLRNFARCFHCGHSLTGSISRGNGGRYSYYHCKNKKCLLYGKAIPKKNLEDDFITLLERVTPTDVAFTLFKEIALDVWETKRHEFNADAERHEKKIAEIKKQIGELISLRGKNLISDEEFLEQKQPLEEIKLVTQVALNETRIEEWDIEGAISYAAQFMKNLPRLWIDYSLDEKHRFQQLVFPDGITYQKDKGVLEPKLSPIYELLKDVDPQNYDLVPEVGVEPT